MKHEIRKMHKTGNRINAGLNRSFDKPSTETEGLAYDKVAEAAATVLGRKLAGSLSIGQIAVARARALATA